MNERTVRMITRIIGGVVVLVFLLMLFIKPDSCDVCLYYKVHPMSILDIIGILAFLGGAYVLIMGKLPWKNESIYTRPHSLTPVFATLAVILAGLLLIFLK